jgi:hypothetical protein
MTPPQIQALGLVQDRLTGRWKATGSVEGLGWLEAWGTSLIGAMEVWQALAAVRVAEREQETPSGRPP